MQYMLLIYASEAEEAKLSVQDYQKAIAGHTALMEETKNRGILLGCSPLKPTSTAVTVRVNNGKTLVTDGPFAETKEQLGGYYLLECQDLDEAIACAAKIPDRCSSGYVGCIEIRPVMPFSEIRQKLELLSAQSHA